MKTNTISFLSDDGKLLLYAVKPDSRPTDAEVARMIKASSLPIEISDDNTIAGGVPLSLYRFTVQEITSIGQKLISAAQSKISPVDIAVMAHCASILQKRLGQQENRMELKVVRLWPKQMEGDETGMCLLGIIENREQADNAFKDLVKALTTAFEKSPKQIIAENPIIIHARGALFDSSNSSALHAAAGYCEHDLVKRLVELGADVNAVDEFGQTALHLASEGRGYNRDNSRFVYDELINRGANVNAMNNAGQTPLHYAAASGDDRKVEQLLERGADHTIRDKNGRTASKLFRPESAMVSIIRAYQKKNKKWWEVWK